MKQFMKYVLATIVGVVLASVIVTIFTLVSLVGSVAMNSESVTVQDNSVVVFQLNGVIDERTEENPFAQFLGSKMESIGLDNIIRGIDNAKDNDNVKGMYIEAGLLSGATPAALEEIRTHLVDFKKTGKFIVAYGDNFTQGEYYLASVADSIAINPQGIIEWRGLAMSTMSYKELLDKVGVKMQIFKVGTYKSAVEPYILPHISDANREQLTVMSGEIWKQMCNDISKSRKQLTVERLNQLADTGIVFADTKQYKSSGMVDKLAFSECVPTMIAAMMKVDDVDDYNTITLADMARIESPKDDSGDEVAVYYAYGEIIDQEVVSGFSTAHNIVGKTVAEDLRQLADDDDVKAVVLRVNSPGGSAYASERIWHEVEYMKTKKPIVVSMGGYAASGGYYISCAANKIVAEPTTLTGSIGIFGMFPDVSGLTEDKLGVHVDVVKTNEYSDFGSVYRPMNAGEQELLQSYINRGYDLFTRRCADGRHMTQDAIKQIAEGRVWTGVHAKEIGLVDQLGGLDDAIAVAKKLAKVKNCTVVRYPGAEGFMEQLMSQLADTGDSYADKKLHETMGEYYNTFRYLQYSATQPSIQTILPYSIQFNL